MAHNTTASSPYCAARSCSVGGRPIQHGAKSVRAARHGIQTWFSRPFEPCVADHWQCLGVRASIGSMRTSAPRVGSQHNHAKSAQRGSRAAWAVADTPWAVKRAGHMSQYSNAILTAFRSLCHRPIAVLVRSSFGRQGTEERALRCFRAPQHNHAKSALHGLRGMLRGRSALTSRSEKRAGCAPRGLNAMSATFRTACRRPVAVLVRSSPGQRRGEERAPSWTTTQPR